MTDRVVSRRAALKALGTSAGAVALLPWLSDEGLLAYSAIQRTGAAPALKVLTRPQYLAVDALVEGIIPADDRSPGAKQARVADYVDLLLSEADEPLRQRWLEGLAAIDAETHARFGKGMAKLDAREMDTLLAALSANERTPKTPLETFFVTTKDATIHGYYTSEIGIHKELRYKGNQFMPEFVGCETEDGKDCPHCGQKAISSSL